MPIAILFSNTKPEMYTARGLKIGIWLRWLCSKFFVFARALYSYNGRILQTKNSRSRLTKFQLSNRALYKKGSVLANGVKFPYVEANFSLAV
jgi:hypothetical protein